MITVTISDQNASGALTGSLTLNLLTSTITLQELIRKRVYEEVREYNTKLPESFNGLIEPTDAERTLNGYKLRKPRQINWETQVEIALSAFEHNGYFVLVDDKQVENLDDEINVKIDTQIAFLKLIPLVGG